LRRRDSFYEREWLPDRGADTFLDPDELADTYWHLVERDDIST